MKIHLFHPSWVSICDFSKRQACSKEGGGERKEETYRGIVKGRKKEEWEGRRKEKIGKEERKEGRKEGRKEQTNEQRNKRTNIRTNKQTNEQTNEGWMEGRRR